MEQEEKVNIWQILMIAISMVAILVIAIKSAEDTHYHHDEIKHLTIAADEALARADSLQRIIDQREIQIKTIYETLDHIPDYVRGMSSAERDSLRSIINPPH